MPFQALLTSRVSVLTADQGDGRAAPIFQVSTLRTKWLSAQARILSGSLAWAASQCLWSEGHFFPRVPLKAGLGT